MRRSKRACRGSLQNTEFRRGCHTPTDFARNFRQRHAGYSIHHSGGQEGEELVTGNAQSANTETTKLTARRCERRTMVMSRYIKILSFGSRSAPSSYCQKARCKYLSCPEIREFTVYITGTYHYMAYNRRSKFSDRITTTMYSHRIHSRSALPIARV